MTIIYTINRMLFLFVYLFVPQDRVSLYSPGWPAAWSVTIVMVLCCSLLRAGSPDVCFHNEFQF